VLTNPSETPAGRGNLNINPALSGQYCNGSRVPPELAIAQGGNGGLWNVPPGISDATVPNPIFNLTPAATVDEGNNWINMTWGPLSLVSPSTNTVLGNYTLSVGSPAIDYVPSSSPTFEIAPAADFFGKPRPDPANPFRFDVGAVEYQGAISLPTLTSFTPNLGVRGSSVLVTLTGTNLLGTQAVNISGTGITVSNITAINSTTVTATFTILVGAGLGARDISVTTSGGLSNKLVGAFTVVGPTLISITPNTGRTGSVVPVTLTGTFLTGASAINFSGAGVTASNIVVVNPTTVTATITIAVNAGASARSLSVVTAGGTTNSLVGGFTVVTPTLTSIAPNSGVRGSIVPVTLTGTNLTGASAINFSGAGVTASNIVVVNPTTVTATITIAANAGASARSLSVVTAGGNTNTLVGGFTVVAPTLTSLTPNTGARGSVVSVTLTGTYLTGATAINFSGAGVTVSNIIVVNPTTVTANFTILSGAATGARSLSVATPGGSTNPVVFTVQ
jgi:hypothetical protein